MSSGKSFYVTSSGPFPTSKSFACWDRCPSCCKSIEYTLQRRHCDACQAASGVSSSYDALLDLFECLGNFLERLEIYTTIQPTPVMTNIIINIMVELLSVLALATKQVNQGRFSKCTVSYILSVAQRATEKFAKQLLGNSEIQSILQRLDRLTQDEARMIVAQTLGVVHGLVGNMKEVMEGA